ncbi:MAG: DUF397 domain-containing protein [Streptosporangiales bacterium]|nr:DUF397 domain-containing protein [Streptosporangiales bacterium]
MTADLSQATWRKSSRSGQQNCVEVAGNLTDSVAVRDSKNRKGPALVFTRDEWAVFVAEVKGGLFDRG